jgi:hypothetical protein
VSIPSCGVPMLGEITMTHKTAGVARLLDTPYHRLWNLIRSGRLTPPPKDSSGDYVWTDTDVERARAALRIDRRRHPTEHGDRAEAE